MGMGDITMGLKQRVFSREFKLHVLQEVAAGKSQAAVARQYQILPKLISRWVVEYETDPETAFVGKGCRKPEQASQAALARENARLRQENELLKKALRCLDAIPSPAPESGDSA
jgi:transposase